eukprot:TRINITY_DN4258_c0_g1_i1.p1 TRINITY_DN4258_c0_g1~~TRINITY_DN4258_c0_g1_i1.p1  ORF type:complete len:708 (-),score=54.37 TRINITY_DN4258_c0_g1_i1:764-2887(-)
MLGLTNELIAENAISFSEYCPEPFAESTKALYKEQNTHCTAMYTYPVQLDPLTHLNFEDTKDFKAPFYCQVKEIVFAETNKVGYIVRMVETDFVPKAMSAEIKRRRLEADTQRGVAAYEPIEGKFVLVRSESGLVGKTAEIYPLERINEFEPVICPPSKKQELRRRKVLTETEFSLIAKAQFGNTPVPIQIEEKKEAIAFDIKSANLKGLREEIAKRKNYGEAVVTYRLQGTEIVMVEDKSSFQKTKEVNWKELEKQDILNIFSVNSVEENDEVAARGDANAIDSSKSILSSRRNLSKLLSTKLIPSSIRALQWVFNLVMLVFLALCIASYVSNLYSAAKTTEMLELMEYSHIRYHSIVKAGLSIQFLLLASKKRQPILTHYFRTGSITEYLSMEQSRIQEEIDRLYDSQERLNLANGRYSDDHLEYLNSRSASLVYSVPNTKIYDLANVTITEKILQLASTLFTIRNAPLSVFAESFQETDMVLESIRAGFDVEMSKDFDLYMIDIVESEENLGGIFMGMTITCAVALIIATVVLFPIVSSIHNTRERTLSFFLNIPVPIVNLLTKKCEMFLDSIETNKGEPGEQSLDGSESETTLLDQPTNYLNKKSRKFKNLGNGTQAFFITFGIIIFLLLSYLGTNYYVCYDGSEKAKAHAAELWTNHRADIGYTQLLDSQRYVNGIKNIVNFTGTKTKTGQLLQEMPGRRIL